MKRGEVPYLTLQDGWVTRLGLEPMSLAIHFEFLLLRSSFCLAGVAARMAGRGPRPQTIY